MSLNFKYISMN